MRVYAQELLVLSRTRIEELWELMKTGERQKKKCGGLLEGDLGEEVK